MDIPWPRKDSRGCFLSHQIPPYSVFWPLSPYILNPGSLSLLQVNLRVIFCSHTEVLALPVSYIGNAYAPGWDVIRAVFLFHLHGRVEGGGRLGLE